jgi:group I intron endonuclease
MIGKIYLIRNKINGKGYVGQTTHLITKRWSQHKYQARNGKDALLGKAIRKYGIENFTIQEVVKCDVLLLNDLEIHYIKFYGTYAPTGHGYNLTEGSTDGWHPSKEVIAKQSAAHKGNKGRKLPARSKEHTSKIAAALKGSSHSKEHNARISAAQKIRWSKSKI